MKKFLYFFAILFFISSIAILFLIIYKSEIVYNGDKREYYLIYYFIALVLCVFSLISLKYYYSPIWLITISTIVFSIYCFQYYFIFNNHQNQIFFEKNFDNHKKKLDLFAKNNLTYDTRTKKEIYENEVLGNKYRSINISPAYNFLYEKDLLPLSGLPNKITTYCNENGYYAEYLSDRYGFNNPDEEWNKHQNEVIALGDSFVNGACVNRPNDIISALRNISNKKDLGYLNLGMDSNGPGFQLATLKEYHTKKTKFILWFYYENNDLVEATRDLESTILQKYLYKKDFKQNLISKQNLINLKIEKIIKDEYSTFSKQIKKKKHFVINLKDFIKLNYLRHRFILTDNTDINNYKKYLQEAKKFSKLKNSELIFVFLPEFGRYNIPYHQRDKNYNKIIKLIKELDIPLIDLHKELFEKQDDPNILFPFGMNGHYNIQGYKKAAEIINKFLIEKKLKSEDGNLQ